jgi:hypothetical protein
MNSSGGESDSVRCNHSPNLFARTLGSRGVATGLGLSLVELGPDFSDCGATTGGCEPGPFFAVLAISIASDNQSKASMSPVGGVVVKEVA